MKTKILFACLIICLFCLFSPLNAQLSLKIGTGIADIAFLKKGQTPFLGYEINSLWHRVPRLSLQGGVAYAVPLSHRFTFEPELLCVMQGLNYNTTYLYDDLVYKINLTYLQTPLLISYKFFQKEKRHSGLLLGPYAAFKIHSGKITAVDGVRKKEKVSNAADWDFGAIVGYAVNFKMSKGELEVGFRMAYSLVNVLARLDGALPDYYGPSKDYARNINVALVLGYGFSNLEKP